MRYTKILTFVFIVLIILPNCSSKNDNQNGNSNEMREMIFEIDSAKIEPAIKDTLYKIQYNPPLGWGKIPPEIFAQVNQQLAQLFVEEQDLNFIPIEIFMNQEKGALLSIAFIDSLEGNFAKKIEAYEVLLQKKFGNLEIKKDMFIKDKIPIAQFLIQKENLITFKLLFLNPQGKLLQFDYIVPKDVYFKEVKSIESSIGSIKLIETEN